MRVAWPSLKQRVGARLTPVFGIGCDEQLACLLTTSASFAACAPFCCLRLTVWKEQLAFLAKRKPSIMGYGMALLS